MEGEAEMEAEARGKSVGEGIEHAAGTQSRAQKEKKRGGGKARIMRDRFAEMEGKVKGKSAESRKGIEHAARRKHAKSLSEIKSATKKVAAELYPLLDVLGRHIWSLEDGPEQPFMEARGHMDKMYKEVTEWLNTKGIQTRAEVMEWVETRRVQIRTQYKVESSTDTQAVWIYFENRFSLIFHELERLHAMFGKMQVLGSVLESKPISELLKESRENLTRIKLETKIKLDEIEEARETDEAPPRISMEAVKGTMGSDELPERISTSEDAKLEIDEAKEMGQEGEVRDEMVPRISTCIETKLEIEEAEAMEEKMQNEQLFDIYCRTLESNWSRLFSSPCNDTTSLSPMHFTHGTQGCTPDAASVASTLQIFSVKVAEIKEALELNWPLHVYGMVAARDTVDRNRNIIFLRGRNNCQILSQKDPCLQLTGPSRAIVAIDPVEFEIKLKVKGRRKSEDRVLMHQTFNYSGNETTLLNDFCKIMLQCVKLEKTVQATIVGVRVIDWRKRTWPFKYDGKISCISKGTSKIVKPEDELVLQDQVTANSSDGYLDLSRHVVSVELNGKLEVIIRGSKSRASKSRGHVFFPAQECKVSRAICDLGSHKVEVTVAWSLLIRDKRYILREGCVDDGQAFEHTAKIQMRKYAETTSESQSATEMVRAKIYSLLNLISKNVMKLKAEPKLRISDYSINEVQIHMDSMYSDVTNLLQMMEKVQNSEIVGKDPVMEKMGVEWIQIRTEDNGKSATEMQAPRTYYEYGLKTIFNGLDQLCTQLGQMGHLNYKGTLKSLSFSELFEEPLDNITNVKLRTRVKSDEIEAGEVPPIISMDTVESAVGKDEMSPRISTSSEVKLEMKETKEMGGKAKEGDKVSSRISTSTGTELEIEEAKEMGYEAKMYTVQTEDEFFDEYRHGWVLNWSSLYGTFTETTSLSPMHFTHSTPGHTPSAAFVASTLQIYSIKVKDIKDDAPDLKWPLRVYGVVAARDAVDHNRNILFFRQRNNYQELTREDPFLRLIGPSRAIVSREPVHVEIELKVKGTTESEDRLLMSHVWYYYSGNYRRARTLYTPLVGDLCTMVLSSEELKESVQATVVGIRVLVPEETSSLFKNGGRVVCFSLPRQGRLPKSENISDPSFRQVVLQDGAMTSCSKGYLNLSRHVVSVQLCGTLEVVIDANSQSGAITGQASIKARSCNITQDVCHLGDSEVEITVAWSRLVRGKLCISMEGSEEL